MSKTSLLLLSAIFLTFSLALLVILRPAKSPTPEVVQTLQPQENTGGDVDVTVTPVVLTPGEKPQFKLEFNTHSVELDFDVTKVSSLIDDQDNFYTNPTWEGSPPGGHHREGTLTFADPLTKTASATLTLRDISGIPERKFIWQL